MGIKLEHLLEQDGVQKHRIKVETDGKSSGVRGGDDNLLMLQLFQTHKLLNV